MSTGTSSHSIQFQSIFENAASELVAQRLEAIALEVRSIGSPEAGLFANNETLGVLAGLLQGTLRKIDDIFELDTFVFSPACSLMLELFQARSRGCTVTIGALCQAVNCSNSVALRWVSVLESMQLLEQLGGGDDSKVALTEKGYFKTVEALKLLL